MRKINNIILHCSATAEGKDFHASDIDRWHRAQGWTGIGYHYVVALDGKVERGRTLDKVGAHTTGHNTGSIGICYIGGVAADGKTPKDTRTEAQRTALLQLVEDLCWQLRLTPSQVHGHYEYASKACPSFDVGKFRSELKARMESKQ